MAMDPYPNQFAAEGWVDLDAAPCPPASPAGKISIVHIGFRQQADKLKLVEISDTLVYTHFIP